MSRKQKRIGIYAGTFNPVHAGHIAFALQALKEANLDKIYFVPERQPRGNPGVEHFGHRVAMLKRATKPHPQFDVLELVDINLTVVRTLPKLQQLFRGHQLVFLFGSDAAASIPYWPNVTQMLNGSELVIALREQDSQEDIEKQIADWPVRAVRTTIFRSYAPKVSSRRVREALYRRRRAEGLLRSVERYSDRHWLYVSLV
jgi:nicotinate-nucleotide adenylyltransferase